MSDRTGFYIRVAEAVSRSKLSERRIRRAIARGELTVVRPPGVRAVLVPVDALAPFLEGRVTATPTATPAVAAKE